MQRTFWGIFFFFFFFSPVSGQYVDSGQDPASIVWKEIKTDNFQILFPEGFQQQALRLAHVLEKVYSAASVTLDHQPRSITVILHTYNSNANANVLWAPSRSNFNTIPPQDIYTQDWLDQLAIHEFRHVVQVDKMHQGMTQLLYYIFGQQATAAVFGLYIPFWFVEGDAVIAETTLSKSGRGRLPSFSMPLRTQLMEKGMYSYEKAYLGSYKDFVPSYYNLGYYLTGIGRWWYGASIWEEALTKSARRPYIPTIFNNTVKKKAGFGKRKFYRKAMASLDSVWQNQDRVVKPATYEAINNTSHRFFTNYLFPVKTRHSKMLVLKSGYRQIEEFVLIDSSGREDHLFFPGLIQQSRFSYHEATGKMAWSEYVLDKRWSNRIYSEIFIYDFLGNRRKKLTSKSFLFVPAISPDGKSIVAIEATPDYTFSFVFIDILSGQLYNRIQLKNNPFLMTPQWVDSDRIVYISLDQGGKKIEILDVKSGNTEVVLDAANNDITNPGAYKNYILFHGIWSGIDNIYAVDTLSKEVFKITDSRFGAFNPSVNPYTNEVLYNEYSANGYNTTSKKLWPDQWEKLTEISNTSFRLYEKLSEEEQPIYFDSSSAEDFEIKPYPKWKHLFNIHSWAPISVNTESYSLMPSVTLLSQNNLSTSFTNISYEYDLNEKSGGLNASFIYKGLYPELSMSGRIGNRRSVNNAGQELRWQERTGTVLASVPLNFTRGAYYQYVVPSVRYSYISVHDLPGGEEVAEINVNSVYYSLNLSRRRKRALLDLQPRWGQYLQTGFRHTPWGEFQYNNQFFVQGGFLLPGLLKNHGINISVGYQRNYSNGRFDYTNLITYPRGYSGLYNRHMTVLRFNYSMPLVYPDLNIPGFIYLKRVYTNLFSDLGVGSDISRNRIYYPSIGLELLNDFHVFSNIVPFNGGIRCSFLPQQRDMHFQFIINLGL